MLQRSGRRERGTSGDTGERSARVDSRPQEAPRDVRPIASQGRVYVREESKEADAQLQAQASYRSAMRDDRHVGMDAGYPAPRVATASSRDPMGDPKSINRQRY